MKIFIDSANIDDIKKAYDLGIIDGVTTNPSLLAKEKKNFKNIIQEIVELIGEKPVNIEVINTTQDDMVKESIELSKFSKNITIKIPITKDGLKVINILNKKNIKTNATLIFSANQALLAAKAGATYVSIFIGRLDDIGTEGTQLVKSISDIFNIYDINTEIIAASIRHPLHVIESAKAGAHISTVPFNVIEKMLYHPLTDIGISKFLEDWKQIK